MTLKCVTWVVACTVEKAMVPHSSALAWKTPWTAEPGRLQSMGSRSWTQLSNFTFTFHFHALEKEMATHSSVLAWRIPGTGKPGGLPSMGSHRFGHDWSDLAAAAAAALYGWAIACLFKHLLKDIWAISSFWQSVSLLYTFTCRLVCEQTFSFL